MKSLVIKYEYLTEQGQKALDNLRNKAINLTSEIEKFLLALDNETNPQKMTLKELLEEISENVA